MPPPLVATVMLQEQLALALNRAGRADDAERVLTDLLEKRGPSSETCGILGRVYKDQWEGATKAGWSRTRKLPTSPSAGTLRSPAAR